MDVELHGGTATAEETAAVVAAIEHFLRDTTAPPAAAEPAPDPWVRAALREGVEREPERWGWG